MTTSELTDQERLDQAFEVLKSGVLEPEARAVSNGRGWKQASWEELRERRAAVKRAHDQGHSIEELMDMFNLNRHQVKHDLERPTDLTPPNVQERRAKVKRLHEMGVTRAVDIAKRLRITQGVARMDIIALGLKTHDEALAERRAVVKALHDQGKTFHEVTQETGRSHNSVRGDYRALGLATPMALVDERRAKVRKLILKGMSSKMIAEKLGEDWEVIHSDVTIIRKELGDKAPRSLRSDQVRMHERMEKVLELYEGHLSVEEIARRLDSAKTTVTADIRRLAEAGKITQRRSMSRPAVPRGDAPRRVVAAIPMVTNAMSHMDAMAEALLNNDIEGAALADDEQKAEWEKARKRIVKALSRVRRTYNHN